MESPTSKGKYDGNLSRAAVTHEKWRRSPCGSFIARVLAFVLALGNLFAASDSVAAQRISQPLQPATCRNSRVSWPGPAESDKPLRLEVDVNGDGLIDLLKGESSCGSGACGKRVQLALAGSGVRLHASAEFSLLRVLEITPVPKELIDPRHLGPLTWIEEALFPRICTEPEPSLAWLLARQKRLDWIDGAPRMPTHYAMRVAARRVAGLRNVTNVAGENIDRGGEVWLFYAGGVHTMNPDKLVELARKGDRVLLGTAHGVIFTNPERSKHAWIYVHSGNGESKLRFPSISGARLYEDTAIVTINRSGNAEGLPQVPDRNLMNQVQVHINLNTGAILK